MKTVFSKIVISCLCLILCVAPSFAKIDFKSLGHYDFNPGQPVEIANPLLWTVNASCKLHVLEDSAPLQGEMKKGHGTLNGQDVGTGVTLNVHEGETLVITASALAKVDITNHGQQLVHADCSLSSETLAEIDYMKNLLSDNILSFLQ